MRIERNVLSRISRLIRLRLEQSISARPYQGPEKQIVAIELTNLCNLKCRHCPQGKLNVPQGFMDENTFRQCLSHCSGHLGLNWRGESTMHPELVRFLEVARHHNPALKLGLHTNGLLLTEGTFGQMVDAGLEWMRVSLHSRQSCVNFRELQKWNAKRGGPVLVAADVDTTDEYLAAVSMGFTPDMLCEVEIANWAGYLTGYRKVHEDVEAYAQACPWVSDNLFVVAWNGAVNGCCWDYEMRHSLGHVRDFDVIQHTPPYELCASCIWIRHSEGH